MIREHVVRCWPDYFDAIEAGIKPFDVRRDDRGYQRGDIFVCEKWCPRTGYVLNGSPLSRVRLRRRITYVLTGGQFGIEPGFVVLGLERLASKEEPKLTDAEMIALGFKSQVPAHASTSPGPVNCSMRLRMQGEPSPRSCERCRLGPCLFFNKDGTSKIVGT